MREAGPFADAVLAEAARRGVPAEVWYQIRAADEVVVVDGVVDRSVSGRRTLAAVTVQARGRRGSAVGTPSNDPVTLLDDALAVAAALPPGPALPLADRVHRAGDSADVDVSSPGVLGLSSALVESARSVRPLGGAVEFRARGETAHTTVATTSGGHLEQVTSLASVRTRVTSRGAAVGFVSHDVYAPDAGALLPALDAESLRPVVATADILARTPVPLAAVPGPVWLHGRVAAGLIAMLAPALLLDGVLHGRSRLAGRVGQSVARAGVSVRDDVTGPSSPVRITFDDEGVATRPTTLIEDGALRGYLADRYWAERGGGESTGSGWRGANG
jgi:predicted Zn-dependent protease